MNLKFFISLFFLLTISVLSIFAQPGAIDISFNPTDAGFGNQEGANDAVLATAIQGNGKIIISGSFTSYNGTTRNTIARLNTDGYLDISFDPEAGANNDIVAIAIQSDDKIIIGGNFTYFNGIVRNRIARLNTDGSLDVSFDPSLGANNSIYNIAIQSDGKILITGYFTSYNGTARNYIARLNTDGTLDGTFDPGTGADFLIETCDIQADGKILIGGSFTSYNGTGREHIARLNSDGSLDTSFDPGSAINAPVNSIGLQSNGKIIIGGGYTNYIGSAKFNLARLNTDGTLDLSFIPEIDTLFSVNTVCIQNDGKIIIGCYSTQYNSIKNRLFRINVDGSLDPSFNLGLGAWDFIFNASLQSDGKLLIGGAFLNILDIPKKNVIRVNTNGSLDHTFNPPYTGANSFVFTTAIQPDDKILIGGMFYSFNGVAINHIARLNSDGTSDPAFNPGSGANDYVLSITIQNDGKIIITGSFTAYNGTARNHIARLNQDGSLDNSFDPGLGANDNINSCIIQSDGKIIIQGPFTSFNSIPKNYFTRLNSDGSLDASFNSGSGPDDFIDAIAIQSDGKIIIAGGFTSYNGTPVSNTTRLNSDGSIDASFDTGTGADDYINKVSIQSDGKIIIAGDFTSYNGTTRNRITRLNSNGSIDNSFNPGAGADGYIYTAVIQSDGKIFITGEFTSYGGITRNYIALLNSDGTLDTSFDPGTGADNIIISISLQSNGNIIIGGGFTSYDGTGRNHVARVLNSTTLGTAVAAFGAKIKIHPNPARDHLFIDFGNTYTNVTIEATDATGKLVYSSTLNKAGIAEINFNVPAGIYFISVKSDEKREVFKVVKE